MRSLLVSLSVTCLLVLGGGASAQAGPVFSFQFDQTPDATLTPPIVGTGTFTFTNDPGDGTFALTSLGAFVMSFTLGSNTYTDDDIDTPLGEVLVVLSTAGSVRRLQFSNTNAFGSGLQAGSIDFFNLDGEELSFEPPGFGTGLNLYDESSPLRGTYLATAVAAAVPEPSSLVLMGTSLAAFLVWAGVTRRQGRFGLSFSPGADPPSSTRGPTSRMNPFPQIGAKITRSWKIFWIRCRSSSRFLRSISRA